VPLPNGNPGWHNNRLSDNWRALERAVGKQRMPRAVVRVARPPGRLAVRAVEHGRGYYGVVMPTSEEGVVCKLTTDPHEAAFAESLLGDPSPPEGIVRYHAIARVSGPRHGRPTWVLWREEATRVGAARRSAFRDDVDLLYQLGSLAQDAWRPLARGGELRMREEVVAWAEAFAAQATPRQGTTARMATTSFARAVGSSAPAPRLGYALAACRGVAARVARSRAGELVGKAFLWALDRGNLLSDLHRDNVGIVRRAGARRYVVTDPGVVLWFGHGRAPAHTDVGLGPIKWRSWGPEGGVGSAP
jgi:hypothetical protein